MSQSARNSSIVNRTDGTTRSTKPSDSFRPHYYTTFQSSSCGEKVNSTTSTPNKNVLPIPDKVKTEADNLLTDINGALIEKLDTVAKFTSVIPNIFFEKNDNYQIQRYLIDRVMLKTLEEAEIINWMLELKALYPIRTSGNGNCLLHAVLIAMIGIHDSNLYLRDRLAQFMNDNKDILKTHWRIERLKSDKTYGISSEDSKLDDEWKELCDLVLYENSEDGQAATHLQFLEAVHIFSVSNMLQRPIIILSEDVIRNKNGEAISVNDLFGIYLPILSTASECVHEPIVLAYDRSHFCPLQTNDISPEKTSDNLLPLYPSVNHIYEQKLLPIRFLGDDVTAERSNNLLREYLQIQEVDYCFDSKSAAIPVLCAKLGSKNLLPKENFFLLYYKYVKDFFEIQKPNAIEEEREREREKQRELDDYVSRHIPYDTQGRSIIRRDTSATRSPRSTYTMNDIQSRNQTNYPYDQQYSYKDVGDDGTFTPGNDPVYSGSSSFQPHRSQRSPDHTKKVQRDPDVDYTQTELYKELYPTPNIDNISNLNNSSKMVNSIHVDMPDYDSKSKREQQRNVVQIPVQVMKPNSSSIDQNLTIYEPARVSRDKCLYCNRLFDDVQYRRFCPECEYRIQNSSSRDDVLPRPSTRSRTTNLYVPTYDRGYTPALSPTPKTRTQGKIICPYCKNPNLSYNLTSNTEFRCSACQYPIYSSYRYGTIS